MRTDTHRIELRCDGEHYIRSPRVLVDGTSLGDALRQLQELGWRVGRKHHHCPKCVAPKKVKEQSE